jgi:PAS domain S-box-containing protein
MASTGEQGRLVALERPISLDAEQTSHLLDSLIEHLPAMVFVKEVESLRFVRFNRAGERLLGTTRELLLGKNDYDLFPASQADAFTQKDREVVASRVLHDIPQEPIETAHGVRWLHTLKIPILDADGTPRFLVGVSMDISEQKRAEELLRSANEELELRVAARTAELEKQIEDLRKAQDALARSEAQLLQSQKMEAIGRLAGGIAHDFNNVLSVVLGYAELVLQKTEPQDSRRAYVEEIERAGLRASELTHQLLAFGRRQVLKPICLDLNAVVLQIDRMLSRVLGEDIDLAFEPGRNLGTVEADRGQIEQVLMNLIVNARDAMPRGGALVLSTENVEVDQQFADAQLGASPGSYIRLSVKDSGAGMNETTLRQIFEPFFTTKEPGKGTGLGLSTVFGIVRQSGGFINARSEQGKGTTFDVYFPRVEAAPTKVKASLPQPSKQQGGTETVLLVEDEASVRNLAADCLRQLGYQVLEAATVRQALQFAETHAGPIHLLLADVIMPGRAGVDLAAQVLAKRPALRILLMSGYSEEALTRHGMPNREVAFMRKPLTPSMLGTRVREVLDQGE